MAVRLIIAATAPAGGVRCTGRRVPAAGRGDMVHCSTSAPASLTIVRQKAFGLFPRLKPAIAAACSGVPRNSKCGGSRETIVRCVSRVGTAGVPAVPAPVEAPLLGGLDDPPGQVGDDRRQAGGLAVDLGVAADGVGGGVEVDREAPGVVREVVGVAAGALPAAAAGGAAERVAAGLADPVALRGDLVEEALEQRAGVDVGLEGAGSRSPPTTSVLAAIQVASQSASAGGVVVAVAVPRPPGHRRRVPVGCPSRWWPGRRRRRRCIRRRCRRWSGRRCTAAAGPGGSRGCCRVRWRA